jgi:hypothetical protein
MSNRRSQFTRLSRIADQVVARASQLILSIIIVVIILLIAVAIRPALLADWTT